MSSLESYHKPCPASSRRAGENLALRSGVGSADARPHVGLVKNSRVRMVVTAPWTRAEVNAPELGLQQSSG